MCSEAHAHEVKRSTAWQSGGLWVATPRKMLLFWFFCGYAAKKPEQKGAWGAAPSTGDTC